MIWRIAGAYEADAELRRDLHQDVLIAVWRALPRFRGEANVRTYIARIAHNRSVSHVGKEAARPKTAELHDGMALQAPNPEEEAAAASERERLAKAIRRLPIDQRQPVTLTLEGFRPREIADVLGVSANVVSIRLTRAKQALKDALESDDER